MPSVNISGFKNNKEALAFVDWFRKAGNLSAWAYLLNEGFDIKLVNEDEEPKKDNDTFVLTLGR